MEAALAAAGVAQDVRPAEPAPVVLPAAVSGEVAFDSSAYNAVLPPWSAAHAYTNLHTP